METQSTIIISFFLCLNFYLQKSVSQNIIGAVVEYNPIVYNGTNVLDLNILEYLKIVKDIKAKEKQIDIIVFPESTLNSAQTATEVPNGKDKAVLCNSDNQLYGSILKNISCSAKESRTAIVVNIHEKNKESNDKEVLYNCDVVFDNTGAVVAKYRKWNLFGETDIKRPPTAVSTLMNIKNTTFGIFTCFDILFDKPTLNVLDQAKNILFPTMWFSELPFLTAIQVQQMFAEENNVAVLAANANNLKVGSGGSGIYIGKYGALSQEIMFTGRSSLTIKKIPNLQIENNTMFNETQILSEEDIDLIATKMDQMFLKVDNSLKEYNSTVLNLTEGYQEKQLCSGVGDYKICCDFQVTISNNNSKIENKYYQYIMVAVSHARSFDGIRNGGIENCGVIACLNTSVTSCGRRFTDYSEVSWPITFEVINITASFKNDKDHTQYPNSLLSSLTPVPALYRSWTKKIDGKEIVRSHILRKPQNRLLTFGIFGRDFSRDTEREQDKTNAGSPLQLFLGLLSLSLVLLLD